MAFRLKRGQMEDEEHVAPFNAELNILQGLYEARLLLTTSALTGCPFAPSELSVTFSTQIPFVARVM